MELVGTSSSRDRNAIDLRPATAALQQCRLPAQGQDMANSVCERHRETRGRKEGVGGGYLATLTLEVARTWSTSEITPGLSSLQNVKM